MPNQRSTTVSLKNLYSLCFVTGLRYDFINRFSSFLKNFRCRCVHAKLNCQQFLSIL